MARMDLRFAAYLPHPAERHAPVTAVVAEATGDDVPMLALLQAQARGGSAGEWAERIHRALCSERSLVITAKVSGEAVGTRMRRFCLSMLRTAPRLATT